MQTTNKNSQSLNVVDLTMYLVSKWKWFLISIVICVGVAWLKYARAPFVYFRSATVIIKDPSNKTSTAGLDRYDNYINKVNVANEILQFRSKGLLREVIQRTHADVSYQVKDGLRMNELYSQAPVNVSFVDATKEQGMAFTVIPQNKKQVVVTDFASKEDKESYTVALNDTLLLSTGRIVVTATNFYGDKWKGQKVHVRKLPIDAMVAYYQGNIGIRQEEDEASILTLSMKDASAVRAEDVLNTLITVYNEEAIKDKNQVAVNTAEFINERLVIIGQELGDVESNLETFKRDNQVVDISSSANMYMTETQKYNTDALELETQLRLASYIKDYLTDPKRKPT